MATKKKMLQAAAGSATGGAGLDITDVFSTYLYEGTGSALTITNGIDLDGEGGLVWFKNRDVSSNHRLVDTERGMTSSTGGSPYLYTNSTVAEQGTGFAGAYLSTSTGFEITLGGAATDTNDLGNDYASWTFRKAPKFFDVVTYTGDGVAGREIAHNLGTTVGMLIVKSTSHATSWKVQHRSTGATNALELNDTRDASDVSTAFWNDTAPTSTHFTVGTDSGVNASGRSYVAYLFAHNDGDGEFGPDGDQDIIKCGSYSQSSASDVDVDLGFEPQFVIVKRSDDTSQWYILDEMRGFLAGSNSTSSRTLYASLANAEADFTIQKTATGFTWPSGQYGSGTQEYIYIAIRRGPLAPPESGTDVFAIATRDATAPAFNSGFPVDAVLFRSNISSAANNEIGSRLTGAVNLETHSTDAEQASSMFTFDYMDGYSHLVGDLSTRYSWMWKRAPGFFDVVAYSGNSTAGHTVSHNLGVAPEMMWVKNRTNTGGYGWNVYHKDLTLGDILFLHDTTGAVTRGYFNNTTPTDTVFTLGITPNAGSTNASGDDYIAYLFATLPGISKVGSYTGNGTSQTIDCGFTTGARFVLIKRTDSAENWLVFDTARGINAGTDPYLKLDTTDAETNTSDYIDPYSSGFTLTSDSKTNGSGASYIFYAIA